MFAVGLVACCLAFQVTGAPIKKDSLQTIFSDEALEAFAKAQQDLSTADFIYAASDGSGHLALCASWVLASAPEPEQAKLAKKYLGRMEATIQQEVSVHVFYALDENGHLSKAGCYRGALPETQGA